MKRAVVYAVVVSIGIIWHWSRVELFPPQNVPRDLIDLVDFRIYYEAVRGNDTWFADTYPQYLHPQIRQGWFYPNWTKAFWWWTLPLSFNTAKWVWLFAITVSAAVLIEKLLQMKGGLLVTLLITKTYLWQIETGNVDFILAALSLTPLGVVLAGGIKFPCAVFFAIHAWRSKVVRKILGLAPAAP